MTKVMADLGSRGGTAVGRYDEAVQSPCRLWHSPSFAPSELIHISLFSPRLAPWAALFRRFAAATRSKRPLLVKAHPGGETLALRMTYQVL